MATYQVWAAPIFDTLAHFQAYCQFFGAGFTTLGWVAQTGHGEIVATGTGASYAWTSPVLPTTALLVPNTYTFKGAFVPSATYVGGNSAGLATECDVVTSAGITYVHITATSSLATAPVSDATNWQPLHFEIWKSNGSNTSSLPIYVKLIYTVATSASTGPCVNITIGTGVDSNGNITNPLSLGGSPSFLYKINAGATGFGSAGEMDFAGDADNFRFAINRGAPSTNNINWFNLVVVDRSKTSTGTDTDAFFYFGGQLANNSAQQCVSGIMLNSALGSQFNVCTQTPWIGAVSAGNTTAATVLNGSSPALPVFPIVGYVANPLLGATGFHRPDYANADGSVIPVWTYGAVHSYIVFSALTAAAAMIDNSQANGGVIVGLLWE